MLHRVPLALLALAAGCVAPVYLPSTVSHRPTILVSIGVWDSYHRALIVEAIHKLPLAGVDYRMVPRGTPKSVSVEHVVFDGCSMSGYWDSARSETRIDPVCTLGAPAFRTTVLHELLHAMGGRHICRQQDNRPNDCVGAGGLRGPAVLNPYTLYGPTHRPGFHYTILPDDITEDPTDLDRIEIARVSP